MIVFVIKYGDHVPLEILIEEYQLNTFYYLVEIGPISLIEKEFVIIMKYVIHFSHSK